MRRYIIITLIGAVVFVLCFGIINDNKGNEEEYKLSTQKVSNIDELSSQDYFITSEGNKKKNNISEENQAQLATDLVVKDQKIRCIKDSDTYIFNDTEVYLFPYGFDNKGQY